MNHNFKTHVLIIYVIIHPLRLTKIIEVDNGLLNRIYEYLVRDIKNRKKKKKNGTMTSSKMINWVFDLNMEEWASKVSVLFNIFLFNFEPALNW